MRSGKARRAVAPQRRRSSELDAVAPDARGTQHRRRPTLGV